MRIGVATLLRHPGRSLAALARLLVQPRFWLLGALGRRATPLADLVRLPLRLLPASAFGALSRAAARRCAATRAMPSASCRMLRWSYLGLSLFYQLELTRAQIPLQRFGKCIEHLVSMLAICHHAALGDETMREVAALQAQLLQDKYRAMRLFSGLALDAAHAPRRRRRRREPRGGPLLADRRHRAAGVRPSLGADNEPPTSVERR